MHPLPKPISFVIVNYKSRRDLVRCLSDLSNLPGAADHEVIIVNNDPHTLSLPQKPFFSQKCIEVNQNIGYAAANNIGLEYVTKPIVCFLNPDTHSFSANFFDITMHVSMHTIASPRISNADSSPQQWTVGDRITLLQLFKNNINLHTKHWESTHSRSVRWVSGAALFAHTQFIRTLHGFDENFFLYFEDVDLCERAHLFGGDVLYLPQYSVVHTGGQSSKKTRKFQKRWYYESQERYFTKHHGPLRTFLVRICRILHTS